MSQPLKPIALEPGCEIRIISLSSPVDQNKLQQGCDELKRIGYIPEVNSLDVLARDSYFAGTVKGRVAAFQSALSESSSRAVICSRGGYGSNYLLDHLSGLMPGQAKIFMGYSDVTSVQTFLWQQFGWVTFYGPMVAAAFDAGAGQPSGYDPISLNRALTETEQGWVLDLQGETLLGGEGDGIVVGGCLTLIETTIGTSWELKTEGTILLLEDCAMKPYQVDRSLMHLKQAGMLDGLRGVILGEFPESKAPAGTVSIREVAARILGPLNIPVVWGVPAGHTARPMLTFPLGIRAHLSAAGSGRLQYMEPACRKASSEIH